MIALKTLAAKSRFCSRLLISFAVLSLAGQPAAAVSLSEYHDAIEQSSVGLESLLDRDGHESDEEYEIRFTKTIDSIRSSLPATLEVEFERQTWTSDNTWLHTALDDLQSASVEDRPRKLSSVLEWLLALDNRVTALQTANKVEDHKGAAKQKLESILARPDYQSSSRGPTALMRMIRDFIRWIESWLPESQPVRGERPTLGSYVVMIAVIGLAVLIVFYIAWLLFKRFKRPASLRKPRKKREARVVLGERLKPEATAADLLSEAEALARNGDLRAAIRKGYIALLVELGDRNIISLAQYKTNRDYLRSVSTTPQLHSPLKKLTESFERHWYGFAQATPNDWQDFRAGYRETLETGN